MGLSSNSLIHLTDDKSKIESILKEKFRIHYCHEIIKVQNAKPLNILVPVVSFFDIPFSQLHKHLDNYGNYGIGLKKDWAKKNGLNPVLYIDNNSILGKGIREMYLSITKKITDITHWTPNQKASLDIIRYLKNYQETLIRRNKPSQSNYRFSDEREWRYVPTPYSEIQFISGISQNTDENITKLKLELNKKSSKLRLNFEPNDINYIIIKSEDERDEFLHLLKSLFVKKLLEKDMRRLNSRVISTEQIKSDF